MKPTVSLCMIVRDEEANISKCLEGVQGLFDEMIVVDTGSVDEPRPLPNVSVRRCLITPGSTILRRHEIVVATRPASGSCGSMRMIALTPSPASALRTCSISWASLCGGARSFHDVGPVPNAGRRLTFVMSQGRLFRNDPGLQWEGRIHERLNCVRPEGRFSIHNTDVTIVHEGYSDPALRLRKQFRELHLLELDYLLNPDDPMTLFYLSRVQLWQNRPLEALRFGRRSITGPSKVNHFSCRWPTPLS